MKIIIIRRKRRFNYHKIPIVLRIVAFPFLFPIEATEFLKEEFKLWRTIDTRD